MGDLSFLAAAVLTLTGVRAALVAAAACRSLPRMYGGGVDIADQPPTTGRPQ